MRGCPRKSQQLQFVYIQNHRVSRVNIPLLGRPGFEDTPMNEICRRAPRAAYEQDRITNEIDLAWCRCHFLVPTVVFRRKWDQNNENYTMPKLSYLVRDPILFVGGPWRATADRSWACLQKGLSLTVYAISVKPCT